MDGKKFIIYLTIFFFIFSMILFITLFNNGWFDIFILEGFRGLYKP